MWRESSAPGAHFGQHRREQRKIFAADQRDLGFARTQGALQALRHADCRKPATQNNDACHPHVFPYALVLSWYRRLCPAILEARHVDDDEKKPPKNPWASGFSAERPENRAYDVREGDYLPPDAKKERAKKTAEGIGAAGLGLGAILLKFKGLLLVLFNLKWLLYSLKFGGLMFASIWLYALFWGWKFALVFVLMILAHELGHYFTLKNYGLEARLPMFIPFIGAYTVGGVPESLEHDAYIALAGPLTGLGVAAICYRFRFGNALGVLVHGGLCRRVRKSLQHDSDAAV